MICLSAALRARKQLIAPSLLKVESTVCFQRKRGSERVFHVNVPSVALFLSVINNTLAFYYARSRNSRWKSTGLPT
ncbi:hypothetical protein CGSMWGv6420LIT_04308 [Gardnerella vaginalis 6420LIT]|nr:hypothetical protein GVAMD_0456 [Gardnerella vaginalis AMD]EIK77380.1 hypothetical protein CGSMWGv6420LIT_04308 [Gardnerella vaginalis 6420LIT]EIK78516.1 hypothetical protein CGSMWGv6420B_05015 [Gardnerella vaginalis 6420B]PMC51451.1 hypothetical protein CJ211_05420 [Gardnerella vaginalis]RIY27687.1 hypothetical protein CJI52_02550 [Bifidobacteriaceae bacterium WP022]